MSGIIRNNSKNLMSLLQVWFPGGGGSDPVVIFHSGAASVLALAPLSPFLTCSPDYLKGTESLPARVLFTHAAVSGGPPAPDAVSGMELCSHMQRILIIPRLHLMSSRSVCGGATAH